MKNIVICCDGTNAKYGSNNTNVVRLHEFLCKDPGQIAFYDPGVGTFSFMGRNFGRRTGRALGAILGKGLQINIEEAYKYLMDYYDPGDKVFLFGFSRGAYTVRALAGMLHKCGLLQKGSNNLIPYASQIYNKKSNPKEAKGFKRNFSRECKPHFIGVWDTVESVGWGVWVSTWGWALGRRRFFNNRLNPDVKNGYHAVSVDEKRRHFRVTLWDERQVPDYQTIEQVWFPGFHSDVGGQNSCPGIPDITLGWMLRKAEEKKLRLSKGWEDCLRPDPSGEIKQSWRGFWRLIPPKKRIPPKCAKIHESVFQRRDDDNNSYDPSNLTQPHVRVK